MKIAYALTGSFCTIDTSVQLLSQLIAGGHEVYPVASYAFATTDTRFGDAADWIEKIEKICKHRIIKNIRGAETVGPIIAPDAMIIAPCTGNTLAKLANGISDTPVTLAAKAHLRNGRPLILALCSNDALGGNFVNIATLYQKKNVYFVPLLQDDINAKPHSMVSNFTLLPATLDAAVQGKQILPLFV